MSVKNEKRVKFYAYDIFGQKNIWPKQWVGELCAALMPPIQKMTAWTSEF